MSSAAPSRWLIILAFACVYIIWGSSYLGISIAIETIPPFIMTATRFTLAGLLLIGWARLRGAPSPTRSNWRSALIAGFILFLINNGLIVYAEILHVPTGVIALIIGITPMWVVLINMLRGGGKPNGLTLAGLALGTFGIVLLVNLNGALASGASEAFGALVVIIASLSWAVGSLYARGADLPQNAVQSTGMQLLCGGLCQIILVILTRDYANFNVSTIDPASVLAMLYLVFFASIIGFTAFTWLMRVTSPALVATYAYVNPVIAVILGMMFRSETLTSRTLIAGVFIIAAVVVITRATAGGAKTKETTLALHITPSATSALTQRESG